MNEAQQKVITDKVVELEKSLRSKKSYMKWTENNRKFYEKEIEKTYNEILDIENELISISDKNYKLPEEKKSWWKKIWG